MLADKVSVHSNSTQGTKGEALIQGENLELFFLNSSLKPLSPFKGNDSIILKNSKLPGVD
jgi:hypothetical protein